MVEKLLSVPLGILLVLGFPVTYILNIVDTWQGTASPFVKILINLTLDAILAGIWPITWMIWVFQYAAMGSYDTPLTTVLGF